MNLKYGMVGKIFLTIFFAFVLSSTTMAQPNYNGKNILYTTGNITENINCDTVKTNRTMSDLDAYKLLYENTQQANGRILDTIYWALGGIATVIIALVGANIFFNFRFNKKEFDNLSERVNSQIEEIKNKTSLEIKDKLHEYVESSRKELKEEIESSKKELKNEFKLLSEYQQQQIKSFSESISLQVNTLRTNFEEKAKKLDINLSEQKQNTIKNYEYLIKQIEIKRKLSQIEEYNLEGQIWKIKEVWVNAFRVFLDQINLEIELERSLTSSLGEIMEALGKMNSISTYEQENLMRIVNKIPDDYILQKESITNLAKKLIK